jgi:hypothetical protein
MATTANDAISDDWQEISDDNFSVLSLPTSDDVTDAGSPADADANGDADTAPLLPGPASPVTKVSCRLALLSITDKENNGDNTGNKSPGTEENMNQSSPVYQPQDHVLGDYAEDLPSEESQLAHALEINLDPTFLLSVTNSLIKLIGEVVGIVHFGETGSHVQDGTFEVRRHIFCACNQLRRRLHILGPIMEGYTRHWDPRQATIDLPIDPSLYEWLSNVKVELLGLQAQLMSGMGSASSSMSTPCTASGLSNFNASLNDLDDQIANFIPIMQADYDDFHTANLPLGDSRQVIGAYARPIDENRFQRMGSDPAVARLRREVYNLKDEISRYLSSLESFLATIPRACVDNQTVMELRRSFPLIKTTLGLLLSNHASEWIEHGLAGGMTYPEFCRLNPDTIRSLILQLRDMSDNMDEERLRIRRLTHPSTRRTARDSEMRLTDFDALQSIEEILLSLFRVRPNREPSYSSGMYL